MKFIKLRLQNNLRIDLIHPESIQKQVSKVKTKSELSKAFGKLSISDKKKTSLIKKK